MDCKNINNLLIDFVDKNLNPEETNLVQKHLENCSACRQEVEELMVVMGEVKKTKDEKPSTKLRSNFMQMIEEEKAKAKTPKTIDIKEQKTSPRIRSINPMYQVAAGFAILISGMFLGLMINKDSANQNQIMALQNEVSYMKQVVMLSKLDQASPSSRIQAVSYMEEITEPDAEVLGALINTMNTDDNPNVRLAATTALSNFTENELVRKALIEALPMQDDPMVQITLINIMVGLHETKAKSYIQNIANDQNANRSVKSIAKRGLEILI